MELFKEFTIDYLFDQGDGLDFKQFDKFLILSNNHDVLLNNLDLTQVNNIEETLFRNLISSKNMESIKWFFMQNTFKINISQAWVDSVVQ